MAILNGLVIPPIFFIVIIVQVSSYDNMAFEAEIPLIIGLVGVAIAVLERGYKRYLEQKKTEPTIKFGAPYMLNLLISTGVGTALVTAVIPTLVENIGQTVEIPVTVGALLLNFILGYTVTYRILDALNTSTDKKMEIAEATNPEPSPSPTPAKT